MVTPEKMESRQGFTLLEVLMAMALFAMVVSVVYGSYSATFSTSRRLEDQMTLNNKARTAMGRISEDIESAYSGGRGFFKGERGDVGDYRGDSLEFTSTAHLVFDTEQLATGYATVSYRVEEDDDRMLRLYRSDIAYRPTAGDFVDEDERGYLLCDGLKSVQFTYITADGDEEDDWDSTDDTGVDEREGGKWPAMVRIRFVLSASPQSEGGQIYETGVPLAVKKDSAHQ